MTQIERLVDQLQWSYYGPAWHGPSLRQNLDGITAEMALMHPIENGHCVWELVAHLTAWMDEVIKTLDGEPYVSLPTEQDWAPLPEKTDEGMWQAAMAVMDSTHDALCGAVGEMADEKLEEIVPPVEFNYLTLILGVIQHSAYHSGQIGILRKAILPPPEDAPTT
jgi:uncharacterized damage-inducible protein DinB